MATPTIREVLAGSAENADVTLVTGSGTLATDMLVALQGIDFYAAASMVSPTPGSWSNDATGDRGTNAPHIKAWTRHVEAPGGAQSVTFEQLSDAVNHGILLVLAGASLTVDGAAGGSGTDDTQDAPSVPPASDDALLICAWLSSILGDYTPPGTMTEQAESDFSPWATMAAATEVLTAAGATGVRTATFSVSRAFASISLAVSAADGGLDPVNSGTATAALTTAATAAGRVRAHGTGSAALTTAAAASARLRLHGTSAAALTTSATATGRVRAHGTAAAHLQLAAAGTARIRPHGRGSAAAVFTAAGHNGSPDPVPGVLVASGTGPTLTAAGAPASTLTAGGTAATLTAAGTPTP